MSFRGILGGIVGMAIFAAALGLAILVFANTLLIERTDQIMAQLRRAGAASATYTGAEVDILARTVVIRGIDVRTAEKDAVRIASLNLDKYDYLNARQPRFADIRLTGLSVQAGDGSQLSALFRQVGLTALTGQLRLTFDAEPEKRILTIKTFRLDITELGDLRLDGVFGNWDRGVLPALQRALLGAGFGAFKSSKFELSNASLDYTDRGMVNRYLKFVAAREDSSLAKKKREILRDLRKLRREMKGKRFTAIRNLVNVFANFIAKPKGLNVKIEPGNPVKVADLAGMDLLALKTRLQLSVTAK